MPIRNDWRPAPELWKKLKPLARQMRKAPTGAEAILWQQLRKEQVRGVKFRRQYVIDRFITDFCSLDIHLIIELDGPIHQYTQEEDRIRQDFFESLDFEVVRFPNMEVFDNLRSVLDVIEEVVVRRKSTPPAP